MSFGLHWRYSPPTIWMKILGIDMLILTNILHKNINNLWQNQGDTL